jgi:hypothetical protein
LSEEEEGNHEVSSTSRPRRRQAHRGRREIRWRHHHSGHRQGKTLAGRDHRRWRWRSQSGKLIPIDVKEGDRVLFGKWSGTEVKIDGEELLIMKESDIMGVLDEPVSKKKAA